MPTNDTPADISRLTLVEIEKWIADQRVPPVADWNPAHCGNSDMRIAADGTWYHEGSPIGRKAMVKLFASILRREVDGRYVLVTPAEKLDIIVDDAPFIAVELKSEGEGDARTMVFRLNTDELVMAGPDHAIRVEDRADGPHPYLMVRGGMEALIARSIYYEMANQALDENDLSPGLWSNGIYFSLAPA